MHSNWNKTTKNTMVQKTEDTKFQSNFIKDAKVRVLDEALTYYKLKDPSLFIQNGFIGGEWVPAQKGKVFPVYGILLIAYALTM